MERSNQFNSKTYDHEVTSWSKESFAPDVDLVPEKEFVRYCKLTRSKTGSRPTLSSIRSFLKEQGSATSLSSLSHSYRKFVYESYSRVRKEKNRVPYQVEVDRDLQERGLQLAKNLTLMSLKKIEEQQSTCLPILNLSVLVNVCNLILEAEKKQLSTTSLQKELAIFDLHLKRTDVQDLLDQVLLTEYGKIKHGRSRTPMDYELHSQLKILGLKVSLKQSSRLYKGLFSRFPELQMLSDKILKSAYKVVDKQCRGNPSYLQVANTLKQQGFSLNSSHLKSLFRKINDTRKKPFKFKTRITKSDLELAYQKAKRVLRKKGARPIPSFVHVQSQLVRLGHPCRLSWVIRRVRNLNAERVAENQSPLEVVSNKELIPQLLESEVKYLRRKLKRKPTINEVTERYNLRMDTGFKSASVHSVLFDHYEQNGSSITDFINARVPSGVYSETVKKAYRSYISSNSDGPIQFRLPAVADIMQLVSKEEPKHSLTEAALVSRLSKLNLAVRGSGVLTDRLVSDAIVGVKQDVGSKKYKPTSKEIYAKLLERYPELPIKRKNLTDFLRRRSGLQGSLFTDVQIYNEQANDQTVLELYNQLTQSLAEFEYPSRLLLVEQLNISKQALNASVLRINFERAQQGEAPLLFSEDFVAADFRAAGILLKIACENKLHSVPIVDSIFPEFYACSANVLQKLSGLQSRCESMGLAMLPDIDRYTEGSVLSDKLVVNTLKQYHIYTTAQAVLEKSTMRALGTWAVSIENEILDNWCDNGLLEIDVNPIKGDLVALGLAVLDGRYELERYKDLIAYLLCSDTTPSTGVKYLSSEIQSIVAGANLNTNGKPRLNLEDTFAADELDRQQLLYGNPISKSEHANIRLRLTSFQTTQRSECKISSVEPTVVASMFAPSWRASFFEVYQKHFKSDHRIRMNYQLNNDRFSSGELTRSIHSFFGLHGVGLQQELSSRNGSSEPIMSNPELRSLIYNKIWSYESQKFDGLLQETAGDLLTVAIVFPKGRNMGVRAEKLLKIGLFGLNGSFPKTHRKKVYQSVLDRLEDLLAIPTIEESDQASSWSIVDNKEELLSDGWRIKYFTFRAY